MNNLYSTFSYILYHFGSFQKHLNTLGKYLKIKIFSILLGLVSLHKVSYDNIMFAIKRQNKTNPEKLPYLLNQ